MTNLPYAGGVMDLSALKPAPPLPTGATFVVNADDTTFEQALGLSAQHPIIVEFTSSKARDAAQFSADLAALADEAAGAYLHVKVDIDAAPQVAQMLQLQSVPMLVGAIAGQLVPLFQGTADKAAAKQAIAQVLQVAAANGVTGRAQPVMPDANAGPDPRFDAADAALASGDVATAVAEFEKLVEANPADTEAAAGLAQARMLARVMAADPEALVARLKADPYDVDAAMAFADLELANGDLAAAFARLIDLVRNTSGEDRERVRLRLLESFETVGNADPAVLKARRDLMTALF